MKLSSIVVVSLLTLSLGYGQSLIFSDDFETGDASGDWGTFFNGEEALEAVTMATAPAALDGGGSYVGHLQDSDGSYTGVAMAVAGDLSLQDYAIEADVYCYVNNAGGSAYTGVVVYADSSHAGSQSSNFYYKLVADFDASNRFRLYNNQLNMSTFAYTFHHSIDASGYYTGDAWHKMRVEVTTVDTNTTRFVCYFDDMPLGDPQYDDTGLDQYEHGQFGLYAFQQGASGIPGYFDNIKVYDLTTVGIDNESPLLTNFRLNRNYPNPFNPETRISFELFQDGIATVNIYDIQGHLVKTLVDKSLTAGEHQFTWRGIDNANREVPSGIYLYRLTQGNQSAQQKMLLVK